MSAERAVLFLPPSLRRFAVRRAFPSASTRYAPLEYDVVADVRPKLVVNLGAGDGVSFFAHCQAMDDHDIDGVCYAVDSWESTEGMHPMATPDAIGAHARRYHPGISYVVKMAPWEARAHFAEATIDVLRVDGTRPDVLPGADVEAWYRRVRPGGVVLWQGAFEAPSLFSLLASRSPAFTFRDGERSLGLARKPGGEPPGELLRLLLVERRGAELERFYAHVHDHRELEKFRAAFEHKAATP